MTKTAVVALLCGLASALALPARAAPPPGVATVPAEGPAHVRRHAAMDGGNPVLERPGRPWSGPAPMPPRDAPRDMPRVPAGNGPPAPLVALDHGSRAVAFSDALRSGMAPVPQPPGQVSLPMALSAVHRRGTVPLQTVPSSDRAAIQSATFSDGVATLGPQPSGTVLLPAPSASTRQGFVVAIPPAFTKDNMASVQGATSMGDMGAVSPALPADGVGMVVTYRQPAGGVVSDAQGAVKIGYESSRVQMMNRLVLANPRLLERDPFGAPMLRREITLLLPEQVRLPETFASRGFTTLREVDVLGQHLVVLRAPAGLSLVAALELAQQLAPQAEADFNHLMTGSGQVGAARKSPVQRQDTRAEPEPREPVRVGLIDEPVGTAPDLAGVRVEAKNCSAVPAAGHGTAVAAVLARAVREGGARPVLYTADLRCGHGAVDAIATALQAMAAERVPVVNLSAVGPHNRVLAAVVGRFLARGHLLVAAVGDDGPAAPPLYPAAYPGVIAVTGVDRDDHVLMEAGRGDHVMFAAPGIVDVDVAEGTSRTLRGTSFAAPVVAAELALRLAEPDVRAAAAAVSKLAARAVRTGGHAVDGERDRVYGFGVIRPQPVSMVGLR